MVAVTLHATDPGPCTTAWRDVAMWTGAPNGLPSAAAGHLTLLSNQLGSGGCTDGPKMEWDPTNHTAWVWWWNNNRIYLRPVAVSSTGVVTPGATIDITGKLKVDQKHATIAIKPAAAAGMNPTIYLTYPTLVGDDDLKPCNVQVNWEKKVDVTWWFSRSTDGGANWTHLEIDHDPAWPLCLSATPLGGNRAIVSPVYDPSGDRLMLSYSRHIDDANGAYVGNRVVTKMWPNKAGDATKFHTWIPICNRNLCPTDTPTGMSCLVNGAPPVGETFCHQYGPAVGVKSSGTRRFAAVFHSTKDSALPHPNVGETVLVKPLQSDIWGYSIRSGPLAATEKTMARITPLGATVPWAELSATLNLWWGDYEDGVVNFGSTFYAIWADNRDGTNTTKLMGAGFNE